MAITINVESVNRTNFVEKKSLQITNVLTYQVDTCSFTVKNYGTKIWKPEVDNEIEILDNGIKIFAGLIILVDELVEGAKIFKYEVKCKDWSHLMDRKLVVESYINQTVNQIINHIKTNYLPTGFTDTNVNCTKNVSYIAFNYKEPTKCIQDLADLTGYDWYVDYDKDIHFFSKEANSAPFDLTDDNGNFIYNSLEIKRDNSQIKNTIYIRGGEYLGNTITEEYIADGEQIVFNFGYKYKTVTVEVNDVAKTVGIDFIDDPLTKDCLFNFNEKLIKFREDNKPTTGQRVEIAGQPYLPVLVKVSDATSVAQYGEYQYKIIDKSIKSKAGARERAMAEITGYAESLSEGSFITHTSGLRSGQKIFINCVNRGINEYFIINKVSMKIRTNNEFEYNVSLVTTKTFGMIELLQKLLMEETKKIEIQENEILEKIEIISEGLVINESISKQTHAEVGQPINIVEVLDKDAWGNNPDPLANCWWVLAWYCQSSPTTDRKRQFRLDISSYLY
jgi:hypothetical protein